jgi:dihydrofolate synthase / folylpolyglutamate synthase
MGKKIDSYDEAIRFLYDQLPMFQRIGQTAYKANLDNTLAIDAHLEHPHQRFRTIHVAGTNGKGSTSHLLASILQEAGYKTGLYTSPHLKDFRERIKIDGEMIPQQTVVDFVNQNRSVIDSIQPSFFEMTVGLAFHFFAQRQVDVAVIEVGLGGRLDSTNIITPDISVITNIGFDHTAILGNTLPLIAAEKAGIIKQNIPVVIGETHHETSPIFVKKAVDNNSPIVFADQRYDIPYATQSANFDQLLQVYEDGVLKYSNLATPLLGIYQRKNAKTVITAIDQLVAMGYTISKANIYDGFKNVVKNTSLLGRWQIVGHNPLIVCDTGHNEDGIRQVVAQLMQTPCKQLHMVIGMVNDKDIDHVLALLPTEATYYFTQAQLPRALDANILSNKALTFGLAGTTYGTVNDAVEAAKKNASINDLIFIGGSTFIVAEAL